MPPYFGFLLSSHLIKEIEKNKKYGLMLAGLAMAGGAFYIKSYIYWMIFCALYAIIIIGYIAFKQLKLKSIGEFDKGVILAILWTIILLVIYHFNKISIDTMFNDTKEIVMTELLKYANNQEVLVREAIKDTFDNLLNMTFMYAFMVYIITSYINSKDDDKNWNFSYIHLLWYIIAYLLINFMNYDSVILKNILRICQNLYIIYGMSQIYYLFRKRYGEKAKFIGVLIGMFFYIRLPVVLFVYGSISSFDLFKKKS
jgi:hypothetical protein